MRFKMIR